MKKIKSKLVRENFVEFEIYQVMGETGGLYYKTVPIKFYHFFAY